MIHAFVCLVDEGIFGYYTYCSRRYLIQCSFYSCLKYRYFFSLTSHITSLLSIRLLAMDHLRYNFIHVHNSIVCLQTYDVRTSDSTASYKIIKGEHVSKKWLWPLRCW